MAARPESWSLVVIGAVVGIAALRGLGDSSAAPVSAETKFTERLLTTFKGHTKQVADVAFSPDGNRLASASHDGTARIWETSTGKLLHALEGHESLVDGVAFSPDGKWVASAGWDAAVRLWDVATGKEVRKFVAGDPDNDSVRSVAFVPASKKLIAVGMLVPAGDNEPILVFDVLTGTRDRKLDGQVTNGLFSVAVSRDGKLFATAGYVGGIRLWDVAIGGLVKALRWDGDERCAVSQVAFSPDGKLLATACDDRMIRIWDAAAGRELRKFQGHTSSKGKPIERGQIVTSVAFSPDGKLLASAAACEGTARLWDVATGREVHAIKAHADTIVRVVFHPDGKKLATAGSDGVVKLWSVVSK
jgi:WD40 repeat protein